MTVLALTVRLLYAMFRTSFSASVIAVVSANAELKLKVNITATAVEVTGVRIAREKIVFDANFVADF